MINEQELTKLVAETKKYLASGLEHCIINLPQSLLVFRLSLESSQRDFLKKINNCISHPMLIRHENGRTKRISKKIAQEISKRLSKYKMEIIQERILQNYNKFKNMQRGHLTSKEAKRLQEMWQKKTTHKQRQHWGLIGAKITATKIKSTKTESIIQNILDQLGINYKKNETIQINDKIYFNVDFLVGNKNFAVIEVTEKQNNLTVTAQALAFRCYQIKNKFPKSIFIVAIPKQISLLGKNVLETTCDKVFTTNEIATVKKYLKGHFFQQT